MDLIKQIYLLFDNFKDEKCFAHNGYHPDWRPNWNEKIEDELNIPLSLCQMITVKYSVLSAGAGLRTDGQTGQSLT